MYPKEGVAMPSQKNERSDDKFDNNSRLDFDSIMKQKDALFNSLESSQTELGRDELLDISARVFENSVKDGLSLATKFRLTPTEIAGIISSPSFILKHRELASEIVGKIATSSGVIENRNFAGNLGHSIIKLSSDLKAEPKTGEEMMKKLQIFDTKKIKAGSSNQLRRLVSSVDDYYGQFVARTELENIDESGDHRTKGEKLAEDSLGRILPALEEKCLAGEVLNTLYQYLKNDDPKVINQISNSESNPKDIVLDYLKREGWPQEDINQLKYEPLVSKELIDNFKTVFKFDKLTERKLSADRYKPLDLVYDAGKSMAKDQLIKEIEQSIKSRSKEDVKVIFNKETKEYEVKEIKLENENKKEEGIKIEYEKIVSEVKEIDISKYSVLEKFYKVGERLVFATEGIGDDGFTEKYIVTEDGQEIGKGKGYQSVDSLRGINNQMFFRAWVGHKCFVATEDGRLSDNDYDYVSDLQSINNKIVFEAKQADKYFVVTENGRELSKKYDGILDVQNINNQVVFRAKQDGKYFVVTEDGREIGKGYDNISKLKNINNHIVFQAERGIRNFIVSDSGQKFGGKYDEVCDLQDINNRVTFQAKKNDKWFIVTEDDKEIGSGYDDINGVKYINNQIVFQAENNVKWFVVTEDGKEIGKEYDGTSGLQGINNQIVFEARKNNERFIVTEDGREIGKEYDDIRFLRNINNQIVFEAEKDGKWFIATEDGREFGRDYYSIEFFWGDNEVMISGIKEEEDESGQTSWKLFKETIGSGKKEIEENDFELSESEKSKLELLNLVNDPEKDKINEYLLNKSKLKEENNKTAWQRLKSGVENSKATINGLNKIISKIPDVFLNTVKAQADKNRYILRDQLLMKIFPEIYKFDSKNWLRGFSGSGGSGLREKSNNNQPEDPSSYLNPEANGFTGGDPSPEHGEEKEVMILRDKLNDFISSSLFGKGLDQPSSSVKSFFSLNHKSDGPFIETTVTLPNIGGLDTIRLPKPVTANLILERVKGVTKNNEEILLETEINSLGEVSVLLGKNKVEKVIYSLQVSRDPLDKIIPKTSDKEYDKYQEKFIKENGRDLKENIADLPEELEFFIESLKPFPPKERTIAIEQFIKQYGYYDFKNGEINNLKNGKSASEQILMMEMRMDQLKETNPELKNKKYAGVCSDFALLNTTLLRKAGILSGVAAGLGSNEKNIYPSMAHGVSYVVFPDNHNLNQVFIVDPTPTGVSSEEEKLLSEFRELSISEKEALAEDEINFEKLNALKSLEEIEKTIGLGDLDSLKRLTNGKLEDALNTILKYEVKADNLKVVSNLLSSYWYSPLNKLDFNNTDDQAYFKDTFKKEINRVKSEIEANPELKERPSGSELFNLIKEFKDRFAKNNTDSGLDLIDKLVEINKTELSNTEQQALTVISNYLRAKNMLG